MPESRATIMERLRKKVAAGLPIIGGGAGTGISAKCEEAGGIDLIVIYNSGRFRMAGRGSMAGLMPYGNANAIVKEMAHEVLTAVRHTPVLAGVCAIDPFMIRDHFLRELKDMGFAGIQNFPTVGLIDGALPRQPRRDGHGLRPGDRLHRGGAPARPPDHALCLRPRTIAAAGRGRRRHRRGAHGAHHQRVDRRQDGQDARRLRPRGRGDRRGRQVRPATTCSCSATAARSPDPADAQFILDRVPSVDGFYGASSMERLPTEIAIARQVRDFVGLKLRTSR